MQKGTFAVADAEVVSEPDESLVHQFERSSGLSRGESVCTGAVAVNTLEGEFPQCAYIVDYCGRSGSTDFQQLGVALFADDQRVAGPLDDLSIAVAGSLMSNVGSELYFRPRPAWLSW